MSLSDYLEKKGCRCIVCASANLDTFTIHGTADPTKVTQEIECKACGAKWDDVFTLTGVDNLVDESGKPLNTGI